MLINDILNEYTLRYPIYNDLSFSLFDDTGNEKLHPLFILTQHIIDSLVTQDDNRIAIVLPDDDCSIVPMVVAKYLSNIQNDDDYAGCVVSECEPGQRLRLGKAVVEFIGFEVNDNHRFIIFMTRDKIKITTPMVDIYYLLEKTEGELTTHKQWNLSKNEAKIKLGDSKNTAIDLAMAKRTALRKTIILLTIKNDFKELVDDLKIDGTSFEDALSYGELNDENNSGFRLYNKGRLDCVPALSISTRIEEVVSALSRQELSEKVFAIFSTADKFSELTNNTDTLKKCLRMNIPFIAFVPEAEFENFPALSALGFELWHWKPSTMRNDIFFNKCPDIDDQPLFGNISKKAAKAANATFDVEVAKCATLKNTLIQINKLSNLVKDGDAEIKRITSKLLSLQFHLQAIIAVISSENAGKLTELLNNIIHDWKSQSYFYKNQDITLIITDILNQFENLIKEAALPKVEALTRKIDTIPNESSVIILITDKNDSVNDIQRFYSEKFPLLSISAMKLSDFYSRKSLQVNHLIVTWFSKHDYIRIKQTYCYDKLIFVLYNFENNWRRNFIKRFDECLPYEHTKKNSAKIGWSDSNYDEKPYDTDIEPETHDDVDDHKELIDYNFHSNIIRTIVKNSSSDGNPFDSVECIPIILSGNNIGYFYPTSTLIEVGSLLSGETLRPIRKEAKTLRIGDLILIRQSGRDIIREKADELLALDGKMQIRQISLIWKDALTAYSKDKTLRQVCTAINKNGGNCHTQQVQYWIFGDTICPENKNVLTAIAAISNPDEFNVDVDAVYAAGKEIQGYHVRAGRWLSSELKSKANKIREIISSSGSLAKGNIDGIGEIIIYTIDEIFEKQDISRSKLNRIEAFD